MWRIRGLLRWLLLEPWPVWLAFGTPIVLLFLAWRFGSRSEKDVRTAGFGVTLLGVVLVAKGLSDTRQMFGRTSAVRRSLNWALRLPSFFRRPRQISLAASVSAGASVSAALGTVLAKVPRSLESRVEGLERDVGLLGAQISGAERRISDEALRLRGEIAAERSQRQQSHDQLRHLLESYSVGGIDFEAIGLVWVIFGQMFGSFPGEVAGKLVSWRI
jgi:hypothetical protein